jgi:hypothetical protein
LIFTSGTRTILLRKYLFHKPGMSGLTFEVIFQNYFALFLKKDLNGDRIFEYEINRYSPLKDVIESLGVPHTEVGKLLLKESAEVDFSYVPVPGDVIQVLPPETPVDVSRADLLHPLPLPRISFMADVNVGKLGRLLRISGFDTRGCKSLSDTQIAETAAREKRIVLTKDRNLLKRRIISHGRLVRSIQPWNQLEEILFFYGLKGKMKPFTICPVCNGELLSVKKETIEDQLEPLTRLFYENFKQCSVCGRIYWEGSHRKKFEDKVQTFFQKNKNRG